MIYYLGNLSKSLGIWPLVSACAKLRIITEGWSFEPRQCGYNRAYTLLGLARVKRKDISGAIKAIQESWQVLPRPHNTSFGLWTVLAKELKDYPEAEDSINDYREIVNAFRV